MKKLVSLALILGLIIIFFVSAHKRDYTFVYMGKIVSEDGVPLSATKIFLWRANLPVGATSYAVSDKNGNFKFQINAFENQQIKLRLQKKGFEPDSIEAISRKSKPSISLGDITLRATDRQYQSAATPSSELTQTLDE